VARLHGLPRRRGIGPPADAAHGAAGRRRRPGGGRRRRAAAAAGRRAGPPEDGVLSAGAPTPEGETMSTVARSGTYTFEDFCLLVGEGQKADLIDGVIYMASPENTDANDLFVWLIRLMGDFVEVKELGKVYGSRVAFRLGEGQGPEPDIAFVRKDRLHL